MLKTNIILVAFLKHSFAKTSILSPPYRKCGNTSLNRDVCYEWIKTEMAVMNCTQIQLNLLGTSWLKLTYLCVKAISNYHQGPQVIIDQVIYMVIWLCQRNSKWRIWRFSGLGVDTCQMSIGYSREWFP